MRKPRWLRQLFGNKSLINTMYIEAEIKWTPFCRQYFQIHFKWMKIVALWLKIHLQMFNQQWYSIGSDNGWALNFRQVIICTYDGRVYWSIYAPWWVKLINVHQLSDKNWKIQIQSQVSNSDYLYHLTKERDAPRNKENTNCTTQSVISPDI